LLVLIYPFGACFVKIIKIKKIFFKGFKPTPVSSLIHAATLVTAGLYLLMRSSPILEYSSTALFIITVIGSLTSFFAASTGLLQNDIKRIIAMSTISQLGYYPDPNLFFNLKIKLLFLFLFIFKINFIQNKLKFSLFYNNFTYFKICKDVKVIKF
jgi:hypothetical protein